jgi:hypothetical protein
MNNKRHNPLTLKLIDFVPAIAGLIGKTALVTSFAFIWAQELNIASPEFVFENVRIEMIIGSFITLVAAIFLPNTAPSGTLAPLIVIVPAMVQFGVHPLILSILVGLAGILSIKTKLFYKLITLSGNISKTSLTLTIGVSGILLSSKNLFKFFEDNDAPFLLILIILTILYIFLYRINKLWLIIPAAAAVSLLISFLFEERIGNVSPISFPSFSPSFWWNEMWGIGYGFQLITILKTLPFALFVILLWTVDTVSIQTMIDSNYEGEEVREEININQSFIITSLRNITGGIFGGAQTGALWRSFLIPLYMMKRPLRFSSILLGILGILAGFTALPIKIMSFPPLIWSVLLFGIFLPFVIVGLKSLIKTNCLTDKIIILLTTTSGILISPIITWLVCVLYERLIKVDKISKRE